MDLEASRAQVDKESEIFVGMADMRKVWISAASARLRKGREGVNECDRLFLGLEVFGRLASCGRA